MYCCLLYTSKRRMTMIQKAIHELVENKNLDFETTKEVMDEIMSGNATQAQISSFLTALRMKGETLSLIHIFNRLFPKFKDARIPTLKEVYELLKPAGLTVNVELKTGIILYPCLLYTSHEQQVF